MLAPEIQQEVLGVIASLKETDAEFRRTVRPLIRITPVKTGTTVRYHHYMSKGVRGQYRSYMRQSNILLNRLLDLLPNTGVDHAQFYALCYGPEAAWRKPYAAILTECPPETLAGLLFRRFAAMDNLWFVRSDIPAFGRYAEIWRPFMDEPVADAEPPVAEEPITREVFYMNRIRGIMASVNNTMTEAEGFAAIRRVVGDSLRNEAL